MPTEPNLERSVAISESLHETVASYLLGPYNHGHRQEHLCFALWRPSTGRKRATAIIHEVLFPQLDEVILHGNASFQPAFLERASDLAASKGSGVAILHNHFTPGWQRVSSDDAAAERQTAPFVLASTGHPLVGLTLGSDEAWSARWWPRTGARQYEVRWCRNVRVVGHRLEASFHPKLARAPRPRPEVSRTVSAWGEENQGQLARLHVGVVGLGSVGRLVSECLARIGVERVTFIDFDQLEPANLDRQIGATRAQARRRRLKVDLARDGFRAASTANRSTVITIPTAVTEREGFEAALDCDVIFSCIDRPWGRRVLNHIAYAHLIPVIDGGIVVRTRNGRFRGAEWSCRTVGPGRRCLACAGAYDPGKVDEERRGILDDPSYIAGLPEDLLRETSQNVLPFSMSLAAHECLQLAALVTGLLDRFDLGEQRFHYNLGEIVSSDETCHGECIFPSLVATGDRDYPRDTMIGPHPVATRLRRSELTESKKQRLRTPLSSNETGEASA